MRKIWKFIIDGAEKRKIIILKKRQHVKQCIDMVVFKGGKIWKSIMNSVGIN